jgi:hypothetical protein
MSDAVAGLMPSLLAKDRNENDGFFDCASANFFNSVF